MNPFKAEVVRVTDPLSSHTRSVRKSLLIASVLAAAVGKAGLIPTQISALGLEFSQADRGSLLLLLGVVVLFMLVSFVVAAAADFAAWRMSLFASSWEEEAESYENLRKLMVEQKGLSEEDREMLQEQERRIGSMWRNAGHVGRYTLMQRIVGAVSWARVGVEFMAPVVAGIGALSFLVCASP